MKRAAREKQDRVRYRDRRAKENRESQKHIAAILRNAAATVVALLILITAFGCNGIDEIIVTVEPTPEADVWDGEVMVEFGNGQIEKGKFTMIILPGTYPDPDIPQPPELENDPSALHDYENGHLDAIAWCEKWWTSINFGTDACCMAFGEAFDMPYPLTDEDVYNFTEYQRGALDAFRFVMRTW